MVKMIVIGRLLPWPAEGLQERRAAVRAKPIQWYTLSLRFIVFTHGMLNPWFNSAYRTKTFFKTIFWRLFERKVLRDARGVMFTCDKERDLAPQSFSPCAAREFVVGYGARDVEGDPGAQNAVFWRQCRKFVIAKSFSFQAAFIRKKESTCSSKLSRATRRRTPNSTS